MAVKQFYRYTLSKHRFSHQILASLQSEPARLQRQVRRKKKVSYLGQAVQVTKCFHVCTGKDEGQS